MTAILLITFALGLIVGLPVAITMGVSGLTAVLIDGRFPPLIVPQYLFNGISSFPLMAVPFFILAAEIMTASGLTGSLLRFANDLVGHIRGGLGHVNVLVSMLFAGISGSALADAAGPSAIVMRMMRKAGYSPAYAGALSAATATIGPIIPPSILMVVYAISDSRVTVAGLFLAGVVPGILLGIALMIVNHWISIRRGYLFRSQRPTLMGLVKSFWRALPALLLPFIIIGGILGGIFTPTEAAAVAAAYALVIEMAGYPPGFHKKRGGNGRGFVDRLHGLHIFLAIDHLTDSAIDRGDDQFNDRQPVGGGDIIGRVRFDMRFGDRYLAGFDHSRTGARPVERPVRPQPDVFCDNDRTQSYHRHGNAAGGTGAVCCQHGGSG
jgi:hypothetical protein